MLDWDNGEISTRKLVKKIVVPLFGTDMLHQIKAKQFHTVLYTYQQC